MYDGMPMPGEVYTKCNLTQVSLFHRNTSYTSYTSYISYTCYTNYTSCMLS